MGRSTVVDDGYMYKGIAATGPEKEIGVVTDGKLAFSDHLVNKVNKAYKIVGLIRMSFNQLDCTTFKLLFIALVRLHLEYVNHIWYPHLKDIEAIENVQRRTTKLMPHFGDMSYQERLKRLDLPTLALRRARGEHIETYKIISGIYNKECTKEIFEMRDKTVLKGIQEKKIKVPNST